METHNAECHPVPETLNVIYYIHETPMWDKGSNEISWKTKLGETLKGKDWNFKQEEAEDWNNKEFCTEFY